MIKKVSLKVQHSLDQFCADVTQFLQRTLEQVGKDLEFGKYLSTL